MFLFFKYFVNYVAILFSLFPSSKDSFVKFWDLDTQHCFLTLVGHRSEVRSYICINVSAFVCILCMYIHAKLDRTRGRL